MAAHRITIQEHFTPADKARDDYAYVPFTLPRPARRLQVRYTYSAQMSSDLVEGGNVVDIGLFDPAGMDFPGGAGFRGWSGSARNEFTIGLDSATPGYRPGPLPAGEYHVLLGLYRIWPQGADVDITIEADLVDDDADADTAKDAEGNCETVQLPWSEEPLDQPAGRVPVDRTLPTFWLHGDLQSHTHHSDAKGTPDQLVSKAEALGLDFLAITDHNTVSHHAELAEQAAKHGVLLLRGQEATTYYGHMNIWGTGRWCDFRCRSSEDMAQVIALAHANGGVCSINHPKTGGPPWEYTTDLPVQSMEVWQGPWVNLNTESFALWDRLLNEGRRLPGVGGSDYHCPSGEETSPSRLGQPTTWVKVTERSEDAILAAICAGRSTITAFPDGPHLDISATQGGRSAEMGDVLRAGQGEPVQVQVEVIRGAGYRLDLIADGGIAYSGEIDTETATVTAEIACRRYVRAELVADALPGQLPAAVPEGLDLRDWRWAASNPVYVELV